ncbi:MAG TPA: right-handed parallel beta-helix repeat-containing protein [Longimicrobiales bacterium]|nr:right-handed parallel beta-helix repeat-containing protein [Longimicrobiales bacterium]
MDAVEIAKPVTILAHSGRPLIVNQDAPFSFGVFAVADGVVRFQGLDFALVAGSRSSIIARFVYPDVVVENCTFDATAGVAGVEAGFNDTGAGRVLVRGSTFRAGATGTFAFGGGILEVRQSVLGEHTLSGVQYQSGSSGVVEDNDIGPCGTVGCVRVFASAVHVLGNRLTQTRTDVNPGTHHVVLATAFATVRVAHNEFHGCGTGSCLLAINGADVEVVDNRFTVFAGQGTRFGVAGSDGSAGTLGLPPPTMLVTDNVITGVGGTPGDFEGYAIEIAAIMAEHGAVVTAQRNTITNAQRGLQTWDNGTFVNSRDNVIDLVWWGMTIFNQSRVEARINDVTRAVEEIAVFDSDVSLSDLTCNWWASAGGPSNVSPGIAPALYTPWATAPVAGTSATSCTGGL